jgi:hypothetical protein
MKRNILSRLFALLLFIIAVLATSVGYTDESSDDNNKSSFTRQELEQMLAPVALYPDALLSQLLMASTYPLEVVVAARWSSAHPDLVGEAAVKAVADKNWDPSVKSMLAFPKLLSEMNNNLEWTERLGDAFLGQQKEVTETVQSLRQKAYDAGHLKSSDQVNVTQDNETIEIDPVDPGTIYVPYYDPVIVYGTWWNPMPPVFWAPWPAYYYPGGYGEGFAWGLGITFAAGFFFGGFDWGHHVVTVYRGGYGGVHGWHGEQGNPWHHDPSHRRGVPYRDAGLRQLYGRGSSAATEDHRNFRGYENGGVGNRQPDAPGGSMHSSGSRSAGELNSHAFEDMNSRGSTIRDNSNRGHASHQQMVAQPHPQQSAHGSSSPGSRSMGHGK